MRYKIGLMVLCLIATTVAFGQSQSEQEDEATYIFYGRVFLENAKGDGVTVRLYDNNQLISTYKTNQKAKFSVGAPLAKHYSLEFVKEGFVTKRVIINTKAITTSKIRAEDFDFNVYLIKEEEDVDYSILDFPMALIEYKKSIKGFDYNKKYTRQMHKIQNVVVAEGFASLLVSN